MPEWNTLIGTIYQFCLEVSHAELIDPTLSMEALVWRLFHEEEKVLTKGHELKGRRCTKKHYERIIAQFPPVKRTR